jgi:hypothetical protein
MPSLGRVLPVMMSIMSRFTPAPLDDATQLAGNDVQAQLVDVPNRQKPRSRLPSTVRPCVTIHFTRGGHATTAGAAPTRLGVIARGDEDQVLVSAARPGLTGRGHTLSLGHFEGAVFHQPTTVRQEGVLMNGA